MRQNMSMKPLAAGFFTILAILSTADNTWAVETDSPITVTISSEIYENTGDLPEEPEPYYVDGNGIKYELESYKQIPVREETRREEIQKEITYSQLEFQSEIPQTADVTIYDEISGYEVTEACSLTNAYSIREQWADGFSLSMTFHGYDADYYQLGNHLIPANEEKPEVDGMDEEILAMIGQTTEHYQIHDVVWDGEPYYDETGILCRNAMATGKKRVKDYVAVYKGVVEFPGRDGIQWEAIYKKIPEIEAVIYEASAELPEDTVSVQTISEVQAEPMTFWQLVQSSIVVTISIGTVVIMLAFLFIFLYERRKKRKQRKQLQPV